MTKRHAVPSPFNWNDGTPSIFASNQTEAKLKAIATARVQKRRAAGDPNVDMRGTSRRADEVLRTRRSFPVEGREAGQASTDKRRSAAKARI